MTLVLEVEYLLGVAFAARSQWSEIPDWPPQPDRVFSALVAAWGARGETFEERQALEWLEAQGAPEVAAGGGFARTAATVFVPPNDPETKRIADRGVLPALRSRQPRRFPAYRPECPVVRFVWRETVAEASTIAGLNAVAADVPYLGHSASLVRCRFTPDWEPEVSTKPKRRIYSGRLAELERAYRVGRRPNPGDDVPIEDARQGAAPQGVFSQRWLVLEHIAGEMPDLRASPLVARALHKAVMAGYERIGLGANIPAVVSGHRPDGGPLAEPHLGFAPMAFLGSRYADGTVFGFAVIPPRDINVLADPAFQRALREIMPWNDQTNRRELTLSGYHFHLVFTLVGETSRRSLDTAPYTAEATDWGSCTPIVLDRHLKSTAGDARQIEIERLLREACVNIGLPEPERVVAGKHPAIGGAPSAYPSGCAPFWTGWRLPQSLASRHLSPCCITVRGPCAWTSDFRGGPFCRPWPMPCARPPMSPA
jgi:CRISPR-associated protein Csb2